MLLNTILWRISVICFNEAIHLIVVCYPTFILRHCFVSALNLAHVLCLSCHVLLRFWILWRKDSKKTEKWTAMLRFDTGCIFIFWPEVNGYAPFSVVNTLIFSASSFDKWTAMLRFRGIFLAIMPYHSSTERQCSDFGPILALLNGYAPFFKAIPWLFSWPNGWIPTS